MAIHNNKLIYRKISIRRSLNYQICLSYEYKVKKSSQNLFILSKSFDMRGNTKIYRPYKKELLLANYMYSVWVMVNSYFFQLVPSQVVLFNWSTRTDVNSYLKSTRTFFWSTRTFEIILYIL